MKAGSKFCLLIILCVSFLYSCKKEDSTPELPDVIAAFAIEKPCTLTELTIDSMNYIDSVLHFRNFSDTGTKVTHHWNFGDGTTSTQYSPDHGFSKSGYYSVSLVTKYDGTPRDTFTRGVHVIIGQKRLTAGEKYTWAVDVAPADGNGLLALVQRFQSITDIPEYAILKTDSVMNPQFMKVIPASRRLENLQRLSDGNYVAAGSYTPGNPVLFAVSKINPQGEEIWTKFLAGLVGRNLYAAGTSDGGILTIGDVEYVSSAGTTWHHTALVKLDANGNELWRKNYNTLPETDFITKPLNFVEANGEYVFASLKKYGPISDSIVLTRINAAGNTINRSVTALNVPGTVFEVGIAKAGNTFLVYMTNTQSAGFFDNNLTFIKFQNISQSGIIDVKGKGDKFYLVDGTNQYAYARRLNEDGSLSWEQLMGSWIRLPSCSGMYYGATRYGKSVLLTPMNDVVCMAYGQDETWAFNSASTYLYRFSDSGMIR